MSYENLPKPKPGRLSDAVERLAGEMLTEISGDDDRRISLEECMQMMTTCPVVSAAVEAKVLLGIGLWGEYENPNEEHQAFIRSNFECMDGSFELALAEIYSVAPLGWVASEISFQRVGSEPSGLRLQSINALNPKSYTFRGRRGNIQDVYYKSTVGPQKPIDYRTKILHVVNRPYLSFGDPTGIADCGISSSAWKAWRIIVNQAVLAGQRQATPIISATSPNDTVPLMAPDGVATIKNADGSEVRVPATVATGRALKGLNENAGYLSFVEGTQAQVLNAQTNGQFFMELLEYLERLMAISFMVPETLFKVGRGGLGNAGLAETHMDVMMKQLRVITKQTKSGMREKVVRQLIEDEYGPQEDYGGFAEPDQDEDDRVGWFNALTQALSGATLSNADIDVVNRYRELARIPKVETIMTNIARNNPVETPAAAA